MALKLDHLLFCHRDIPTIHSGDFVSNAVDYAKKNDVLQTFLIGVSRVTVHGHAGVHESYGNPAHAVQGSRTGASTRHDRKLPDGL